MARFRVGRFFGVLGGTVAILAVGIYVPATILGPLPTAVATPVQAMPDSAGVAGPALPDTGGSAVILAGDTVPFAVGGSAEALPMASIAKLVTALVVLDARPLDAGAAGESHTIGTADYQDYIDYSRDGARTVVVFPKEEWTEREMLQALVLGSSNNHADTLARWAFDSVDGYLDAASGWLERHELDGIEVADATGLSPESRGTAADVTRLAALVQAEPAITEILANPPSALVNNRGVSNTTAYLADAGVRGISRSYTDEAGVCLLFTARIDSPDAGGEPLAFSAVYLGASDYDTLEAEVLALLESARAGAGSVPLIQKGSAYATLSTAWGAEASALALSGQTRTAWSIQDASMSVSLDPISTGSLGAVVGRVSVSTPGGEASSRLQLDRALPDPGIAWRLANPVPVIASLIDSLQG